MHASLRTIETASTQAGVHLVRSLTCGFRGCQLSHRDRSQTWNASQLVRENSLAPEPQSHNLLCVRFLHVTHFAFIVHDSSLMGGGKSDRNR